MKNAVRSEDRISPKTVCVFPAHPLSAASGIERYNTLDFASKIVCQQGCCSPLLETPNRKRVALFGNTPYFFAITAH